MPCKNDSDWLQKVNQIAADSSKVILTKHAKLRLDERGLSLMQVLKVFQCGTFSELPAKSPNGDWKFTMRHHITGEFISAAGALSLSGKGESIIVITVFN
jgi:hypothetical protein